MHFCINIPMMGFSVLETRGANSPRFTAPHRSRPSAHSTGPGLAIAQAFSRRLSEALRAGHPRLQRGAGRCRAGAVLRRTGRWEIKYGCARMGWEAPGAKSSRPPRGSAQFCHARLRDGHARSAAPVEPLQTTGWARGGLRVLGSSLSTVISMSLWVTRN